jgi:hypothetical protein
MRRFAVSLVAVTAVACVTLLALLLVSCSGSPPGSPVLTADIPLHLEEHLDAATIVGSDVPEDVPQSVVWSFDEAQPDWLPAPVPDQMAPVRLSVADDALRMTLGDIDVTDDEDDAWIGGIYVDLPDWRRDDWGHIQVRARSDADVDWMSLLVAFNLRDESEMEEDDVNPTLFEFIGETATVIRDGGPGPTGRPASTCCR